jgi:hypothetical protein
MAAFWDIAYSLVELDYSLIGAYCLSHRGDRPDAGDSVHLGNVLSFSTRLHGGAVSQKAAMFILAAVR